MHEKVPETHLNYDSCLCEWLIRFSLQNLSETDAHFPEVNVEPALQDIEDEKGNGDADNPNPDLLQVIVVIHVPLSNHVLVVLPDHWERELDESYHSVEVQKGLLQALMSL